MINWNLKKFSKEKALSFIQILKGRKKPPQTEHVGFKCVKTNIFLTHDTLFLHQTLPELIFFLPSCLPYRFHLVYKDS